MRETITQDYQDYFFFLGPKPRSTWQDLVDLISDHADFEVGVTVGLTHGEVNFYSKSDGKKFNTIKVPKENLLEDKGEDIDPNKICHEICRVIKENKIIKRPRKVSTSPNTKTDDVAELKRLRENLVVKIWSWKKWGKDTTQLEKDLVALKAQEAEAKKKLKK